MHKRDPQASLVLPHISLKPLRQLRCILRSPMHTSSMQLASRKDPSPERLVGKEDSRDLQAFAGIPSVMGWRML